MRIDYVLIPLGAFAFVAGVTTLVGTLLGAADWWIGISIVLLALSWEFTLGHLLRRRRNSLATVFAVTDRRVLRARRADEQRVESLSQEFDPKLTVVVKPQYDDRATIVVGDVTLFNIDGYVRVETLIRQQLPAETSR